MIFTPGGEDVVVELVDFFVDAFEDAVGVYALLEEEDAFDDVVRVSMSFPSW